MSLGETLIEVDPQYFRPTEVEILLGDPGKARKKLGWQSEYSVEESVKDIVQSDMGNVKITTAQERL